MPHISYSELKDWVTCAFYHKLTRVDKLKGFKGNAFTAFGTAIHAVCEKKLLKEDIQREIRSLKDIINNDVKTEVRQLKDFITDNIPEQPEEEEEEFNPEKFKSQFESTINQRFNDELRNLRRHIENYGGGGGSVGVQAKDSNLDVKSLDS